MYDELIQILDNYPANPLLRGNLPQCDECQYQVINGSSKGCNTRAIMRDAAEKIKRLRSIRLLQGGQEA